MVKRGLSESIISCRRQGRLVELLTAQAALPIPNLPKASKYLMDSTQQMSTIIFMNEDDLLSTNLYR